MPGVFVTDMFHRQGRQLSFNVLQIRIIGKLEITLIIAAHPFPSALYLLLPDRFIRHKKVKRKARVGRIIFHYSDYLKVLQVVDTNNFTDRVCIAKIFCRPLFRYHRLIGTGECCIARQQIPFEKVKVRRVGISNTALLLKYSSLFILLHADQRFPASRNDEYFIHTRHFILYSPRERRRYTGCMVIFLLAPVRGGSDPVNTVAIRMIIIKTGQEAYEQEEHDATRDRKRQSRNINDRKTEASSDVSDGDNEMVSDHDTHSVLNVSTGLVRPAFTER